MRHTGSRHCKTYNPLDDRILDGRFHRALLGLQDLVLMKGKENTVLCGVLQLVCENHIFHTMDEV
jgi:hypothetical protein